MYFIAFVLRYLVIMNEDYTDESTIILSWETLHNADVWRDFWLGNHWRDKDEAYNGGIHRFPTRYPSWSRELNSCCGRKIEGKSYESSKRKQEQILLDHE
jgi:hypothetical protein